MLDTFQSALYQRLQAFELDDPTHEFGFTRHLMKNQGWTLTYTQKAIAEYKKFAFLTVVANHQVVPSDQVDQVWHAHVLLTKSYWEEFCPKVLGKKLHHHPARGGREERAEFHRLYVQTIESYRHFFGSPPTDIWSPPDVRFGTELKMQRINLSIHWVIPKQLPQLSLAKPLVAVSIFAFMTVGCVDSSQGSTFEKFISYFTASPPVSILGAALILGLMLRYVISGPSKQPQRPQLDIYQMAYLAGGSSRAVELAILQLVHQGYLRPNVRNRTLTIKKSLPSEATNLQRQVMRQVCQTPDLRTLKLTQWFQTSFIEEYLQQKRLLMTGWAYGIGINFPLFAFMWVPGFMILELLAAVLLNILGIKIREILIVLWMAIGTTTAYCMVPGGRTRWGSRILADIRKNHDVYDVTQRFALYGDQVLSGGALDDLKQIIQDEAEEAAGVGCGC